MRNIQVGIAVAAALVVTGLFFVIGNPFDFASTLGIAQQPAAAGANPGDLVVQDEVVGTGLEAQSGDTVLVHYTGRLQNGTVFDTSVGGDPRAFVLGAGNTIPGWDMGLLGMKEGGKRQLIIGPSLGFGAEDYGPIPGNSTLIFEVELVKVDKPL